MIRKQAFMHFNQQPFEQKWIDMVHELAPEVETATSSDKDPMNERHSEVSWIDSNEKSNNLFQYIYEMVHAAIHNPTGTLNMMLLSLYSLHNIKAKRNNDTIGMLIT